MPATGQHRGKVQPFALGLDKGPGRLFRDRLALAIGVDAGAVQESPVRFGKNVIPVRMAPADGMEGRGQNHPLHPGIARRAQDAQRSVARGHDHIILLRDMAWPHG
jgi:hypothetical protein